MAEIGEIARWDTITITGDENGYPRGISAEELVMDTVDGVPLPSSKRHRGPRPITLEDFLKFIPERAALLVEISELSTKIKKAEEDKSKAEGSLNLAMQEIEERKKGLERTQSIVAARDFEIAQLKDEAAAMRAKIRQLTATDVPVTEG